MMNSFLWPGVVLVLLVVPLQTPDPMKDSSGADSLAGFSYRPEKIEVGAVYHYVKSNQDGSRAGDLYLRVEAEDRITAFKPSPGAPDSAYITAVLDWSMFCPKRLEARRVDRDGRKRLQGTAEFVRVGEAFEIRGLGKILRIPASSLPVHSWDFDFASLNFSLRHLVDPTAPFSIGIVDYDYEASSPAFVYRGQVQIDFLTEEVRGGIPCRKYSIDGPGLENRGGFAWVSKKDQHAVEFEIGFPDEPGFKDVRIRLEKVTRMTEMEWEELIVSRLGG